MNEYDEVEGFNGRLLIGATDLPLQEIIAGIHGEGGIAIAAQWIVRVSASSGSWGSLILLRL